MGNNKHLLLALPRGTTTAALAAARNIEVMSATSHPTSARPKSSSDSGERPPAPIEPRKRQIMAATERLIAEQGFDGLRLRDVAKSAGVSIGTIQHYFDTRDGLVLETLAAASWRRADEFIALGKRSDDPIERTRALLRGSIPDRARCQAWMETCSSSTRHAELVPMIERIYEAWRVAIRQAIKDGIEAGAFTPQIPFDQVIDTIMTMIEGLMTQVGLQLYNFDEPYVALLIQDIAGRLLSYDFEGATDGGQLTAG